MTSRCKYKHVILWCCKLVIFPHITEMSQYSRLSPSFVTKQLQTQRQNLAAVCRLIMHIKCLRGIFQFCWNWKPVRINHAPAAPASVWTMHRPYWPQCDIARSPSWHLYWTKTKTPALIYSAHMVLVIWVIVAHFHLCSLLGTLSRYTVLEVWLYPGIAPGWGYYFKPTKTKNPEKKNWTYCT